MNKIVKKSMAGMLAGVMALSSMIVGTTSAFAAELPKDDGVLAVGAPVSFTGTAEKQTAVYKFQPSTTGYYQVSFSTDAIDVAPTTETYYDETYNYTGKRSDEATLDIKEYYADEYYSGGYDYNWISSGVNSRRQYTKEYKETVTTTNDKTTYVYDYTYASVHNVKSYKFDKKNIYYFTVTSEKSGDKYAKANLSVTPLDYQIYDLYIHEFDRAVTNPAANVKVITETAIPYLNVFYRGRENVLVIPDQIDGINVGEVSGADNKHLTSLTLGKNVMFVDGFDEKYELSSLQLNEGLLEIYGSAFAGDKRLTGRIVIPASVEYIGGYAFYDTGYDSAQVLNAETTVGECAFGYKEVLNEATADPRDTMSVADANFFMIAPANSPAEYYAQMNGIVSYDIANCAHRWAVTASKAATYFAKGSTTETCAVCGKVNVTVIPQKKIKLKSAKSSKAGQITVKTAALDAKVTGYQIQYSTSKKFTKKTTKSVKVKTNSKKALSKTVKGLKKGKKYYVRVRVYSGKKNGAWSAKKAVKVKK